MLDLNQEGLGIFEFERAQAIFSRLELQKQAFHGYSLSEKLDIAPILTKRSQAKARNPLLSLK
jgi:hypothetical protein